MPEPSRLPELIAGCTASINIKKRKGLYFFMVLIGLRDTTQNYKAFNWRNELYKQLSVASVVA